MIFESGRFVLDVLSMKKPPLGGCGYFGCVYLIDMVNIIRFGSELCGEVLLNIEVVFGICVRQILVVRMLGDIKLVRHERTHTAKLQDALATVEDGKLVYRCKIFAQLLIVEGVGDLSATALAGIECVDGFLAERLVQFFQRGRLRAAEENTTIHVADDRIGINTEGRVSTEGIESILDKSVFDSSVLVISIFNCVGFTCAGVASTGFACMGFSNVGISDVGLRGTAYTL